MAIRDVFVVVSKGLVISLSIFLFCEISLLLARRYRPKRIVPEIFRPSLLPMGVYIAACGVALWAIIDEPALRPIFVVCFIVVLAILLHVLFLRVRLDSDSLVIRTLLGRRIFRLDDVFSVEHSTRAFGYVVTDIKGRRGVIPYYLSGADHIAEILRQKIRIERRD